MKKNEQRPNILFLLSDQHSASFLGCNGNSIVDTPNLDKLSKEGVYFENAYCQNPLCVPSRYSMLTGQYTKQLGIYENRHVLESNSMTLPRVFAQAGYQTCVIGKTHFNGDQFQGYQQRPYGDLFGQGHQPDYIRTGKEKSESGLEDLLANSGATHIPLAMTQTEICVSETAKWLQTHIERSKDKPFFLSVNFDKPHFPYRTPAKYFNKYKGKVKMPDYPEDYANKQAVPFVKEAFVVNGGWSHYGKDKEIHEQALAAYYGCVEWVDDAIGRILDALDFLDLAENTIVIYTSDHGEMAGEKGAWQKTVFFDPSAKVPLIVKWPEKFMSNKRVKDLVGLIDLFPTLCESTGLQIPSQCDGISLTPILQEGKCIDRKEIYVESVVLKVPEHAGCMIRTPEYKYCLYLDGHNELYDMEKDPEELNNLSGDPLHKEIENELNEKVVRFWEPDKQMERYLTTPRMQHEKHFYLYSNQYIASDGTIINARP